MDDCYLTTVNADTLADFLSLGITPDVLESLNHRINSGELRHDQMYIFACGENVEAAFTVTTEPIIVPRIKTDIPERDVSLLAQMLHDLLEGGEKIVIIDNNLAVVDINAFTGARWKLHGHDKIYETDLAHGEWKLDSEVLEVGAHELLSADMLDFYEKILETDDAIGDTGSRDPSEAFEDDVSDDNVRLFVLKDHQTIIAAATLFPMAPDQIGIQILGVIPSARGQGLGGRLHAHLLATAKLRGAKLHVGGTNADNTVMHNIYRKNGAKMVSEQFQLVL